MLDLLDAAGVPRERLAIDLGLARGLDYYTGVVFETTINGWEKFGSVASGGRYDNLASLFTPRRLPGVGASIGLDRLLALLDEAGRLTSASDDGPGPGRELSRARTRPSPFSMAARLRAAGIGAEVYPDPIPIGKQMGYGSSRGPQAGGDRRARRGGQAGLQPAQPRHPAGGQGARLVGPGRLGAKRARDHQAGRGRLMTAPAAEHAAARRREPRSERPVGLVRGTRDWLPADCARLGALERQLLDGFARAGYEPIRTPILEFTELHERKSGAGIVSKLFELAAGGPAAICLRPELTASIVRAFAAAASALPCPGG